MGIKIVSDEEAEKAEFVACVRKENDSGFFTDNLEGKCCACDHTVVFRPTAPKTPKRICLECMLEQIESDNATKQ